MTTTADNNIIPKLVEIKPSVRTLNNAPDARSLIPKYVTENRNATNTVNALIELPP